MIALAIVLGAAGTVLVFTEVPGLFLPGLFLLAAAGSCFVAASVAYMAELFPTEVRASLTAFVLSARSSAGSVGLAVLGGLAGVVSPSLLLILGGCLAPAVLALRGLPETAGRDLIRGTLVPVPGRRRRTRRRRPPGVEPRRRPHGGEAREGRGQVGGSGAADRPDHRGVAAPAAAANIAADTRVVRPGARAARASASGAGSGRPHSRWACAAMAM